MTHFFESPEVQELLAKLPADCLHDWRERPNHYLRGLCPLHLHCARCDHSILVEQIESQTVITWLNHRVLLKELRSYSPTS